jgi:hypothetical protein
MGAGLATRDRIKADQDASAPSAALAAEPALETCEADPREQIVAMSSEPPACYAPPAFPAAPAKYESSIPPGCGPNESCAIAGP